MVISLSSLDLLRSLSLILLLFNYVKFFLLLFPVDTLANRIVAVAMDFLSRRSKTYQIFSTATQVYKTAFGGFLAVFMKIILVNVVVAEGSGSLDPHGQLLPG